MGAPKKATRKQPHPTPRRRRVDAEPRVDGEVWAFYRLGREVNELHTTESRPVFVVAREIARARGLSHKRVIAAARVADRFDDEDVEDVRRLCTLSTTTGKAVGVFHIRLSLAADTRTEQLRWLDRAASGGWSANRLRVEMRKASGDTIGRGGVRARQPVDLADGLHPVLTKTDEWLRRYRELWDRDWSVLPKSIGRGRTPPKDLAGRLQAARERLGELGRCAKALEKRLSVVEQRLGSAVEHS
jgi:hypothetical protein